MQQVYTPPPAGNIFTSPKLRFTGNGGSYFGILIVNALLCAITLGIYYPWARVKKLEYLYNSTDLDGSSFTFTGTASEIFKGFIKLVGLFVVLMIANFLLARAVHPIAGMLLYIAGFILLLPFAIHGANRYRWSRTTWRGIRFGYRGDRSTFVGLFFKEFLLTIITFGIYGSWMAINLRNYIISNIRFGSGEFRYQGNGTDFFLLNLKGYFLTLITLGIYGFWWQADVLRYYIDKMTLVQGNRTFTFRSTATGGQFAGLILVNVLIIFCTLGIGFAWAQVRTFTFLAEHVEIEGDVVLEELMQTEEEYHNAMGEDIIDFLDIDLV
ncbi:Uncharacterized membrane protein YjgN, DUF898 family [Chitinophaga jiangningensis]|uniref:Uncharacterized membrane protein YjgN, DUF898 family n=1 Tax=Chitinophaga jiangningensis TaxID=1419482 RepID=A0A1M7J092_9BACT|nr:YjgN family protein [Chitinophaga jiangningensis]SHM46365.1 Uncharacterized membrane protein YjgN, DUF898 family [Chitinophaga jiangningensis]